MLTWSVPLVAPGGSVVAMKGSSAAEEVAAVTGVPGLLARLGVERPEVLQVGTAVLSEPATVVRATLDPRRRLRSRSTQR